MKQERRHWLAAGLAVWLLVVVMGIVGGAGEVCADTTWVSGRVSGEWTREGNPYIVVDSTWVAEGDTLRIGPGVSVLFDPSLGFYINGMIVATGTSEDSIRFSSRRPNRMWRGIRLLQNDVTVDMSYLTISMADTGVFAYRLASLDIHSTTISYCNSFGLYTMDCERIILSESKFIGSYKLVAIYGAVSATCEGNLFVSGRDYALGLIADTVVVFNNIVRLCGLIENAAYSVGINIASYGIIHHNVIDSNHAGLNVFLDGYRRVYNNTISNNVREGITLGGGQNNAAVFNNMIVNNIWYGVFQYRPFSGEFHNNMLWGNGRNYNRIDYLPRGVGELAMTNANGDSCDRLENIYFEPHFITFGDRPYGILPGCKAIDAGSLRIGYDADETFPDIGAFPSDRRRRGPGISYPPPGANYERYSVGYLIHHRVSGGNPGQGYFDVRWTSSDYVHYGRGAFAEEAVDSVFYWRAGRDTLLINATDGYLVERRVIYIEIYHSLGADASDTVNDSKEWLISAPYPNPSNGDVRIELLSLESQPVEFIVYSLDGRIIHKNHTIGTGLIGMYSIPTRNLPAGDYILHLRNSVWNDVRRITIVR